MENPSELTVRVADAGIGVWLDKRRFTAAALRAAILRVLDEGVFARAFRFRRRGRSGRGRILQLNFAVAVAMIVVMVVLVTMMIVFVIVLVAHGRA